MRRAGIGVKRRLGILFDVWEEVIGVWEREGGITRERVVEIMREYYEREGVSPIKGASNPPDLYDKELASLYVVGKHAWGLDASHPDLFDTVFGEEVKYEEAIKALLSDEPQRARLKVQAILGRPLDDNTIARMLRLKLTEAYFGFSHHDTFKTLLKRLVEAFPEHRKTASKYARFYIAFRIAEAIQKGEVRDRITKEAMKQALALEFSWLDKVLPDDAYIKKIAEEVFHIPRRILETILPGAKKREKGRL